MMTMTVCPTTDRSMVGDSRSGSGRPLCTTLRGAMVGTSSTKPNTTPMSAHRYLRHRGEGEGGWVRLSSVNNLECLRIYDAC